jgi:hypothetical protein
VARYRARRVARVGDGRESAYLGSRSTEVARRRATIFALIDSLELVEIDNVILNRAAQPMPTEIGTFDAIHLASALLWNDALGLDALMATHDRALGRAAQGARLQGIGDLVTAGGQGGRRTNLSSFGCHRASDDWLIPIGCRLGVSPFGGMAI